MWVKTICVIGTLFMASTAWGGPYSHCDEPQNYSIPYCAGYNAKRTEDRERRQYKEEKAYRDKAAYEQRKSQRQTAEEARVNRLKNIRKTYDNRTKE